VGRGTASRVINDTGHVSAESRAAVLQAVEELGYVPNQTARALVRKRTDTVAFVVVVTEEHGFWADPFYSPLVRGAQAALAQEGVQLLLAIAHSQQERERLSDFLTGRHIDGVLLSSLHDDDPLPGRLAAGDIPAVMVGSPTGYSPDYGVDLDNEEGGRRAARHLVERGRRRIAVITGPLGIQAGVDRWTGFRDALAEAGVPQGPVEHGDFTLDSGAEAMRRLLRNDDTMDAVFAANDLMAAGALRVLRESGRRVPEDVAVVGFDDSSVAVTTDPPLTSVHQPIEEMGREVARLMMARLGREPVAERKVVFEPRLVVRGTT